MKDLFYKLDKPQWEYKYGDVLFSKFSCKKLAFLIHRNHDKLYQEAYNSFFKYIRKYEDYSTLYKESKRETSLCISKWIRGKKILSWGCGTAYVEEMFFEDEDITLMDEANISKIGKREIYSPEILNTWTGNCIIGIQLVFHLNRTDLGLFFNQVSNLLEDGGLLIITHSPRSNILVDSYDLFFNLFNALFNRNRTYVLWGWRRSSKTYKLIAQRNNLYLKHMTKNKVNKEDVMIFEKINLSNA